ncbi:MAG: hypothetical protein LM583_06830 [Desulfurococcaceae archaeon]|nr:hypothetical protein [Desulfurococcaceae archaeon]
MPDIVLDYHRLKTPIDHPDLSVTRSKLEYPTVGVSFAYLDAINKTVIAGCWRGVAILTSDSFTDMAVQTGTCGVFAHQPYGRFNGFGNYYATSHNTTNTTADHELAKVVNNVFTRLAYEAVDLVAYYGYLYMLSISGSTLKSFRTDMTTPKLTATDTTFASGQYGIEGGHGDTSYHPGGHAVGASKLLAPSSPSPPAQAILELPIAGSGKYEDPFTPKLSQNLAEIPKLSNLPDYLYEGAKKYEVLKRKGFTDEEIRLLPIAVPQYYVDLDAVTWGAFEFHPDKANTVIITITGDNPYKSGAIDRQKTKAKSVFNVPGSYNEAINLYNQLKKDYPHWLAGVHNLCYQIFGYEFFDWLQNVDFYYGELIEHKTHYNQLKQVPDWEIRNRLLELRDKISRMTILTGERDKHLRKIDVILRRGW